jgi:enoyl-CoA hydratase/carnithine racemase
MTDDTRRSFMATTMPADEPLVLRDADGGIVTLTLNRPRQYNALSREMLEALQGELDALTESPDARIVIIAAAGPAFCAGHDLKQIRAMNDRAEHQTLFAQCSRMMMSVQQLPQPVIAQVHGIATAAGCQLVAACDLAVAAVSARFAVSGINAGLFCSTPAVALSRNIGRKAAMEMLLTGEFIDAEKALDRGLVNRVVPDAELPAATRALAATIAAKSPLAVRTGKRLFYRQLELSTEQAYACAGEAMACNMDSEDAREGVDAFIEKREPRWRGR